MIVPSSCSTSTWFQLAQSTQVKKGYEAVTRRGSIQPLLWRTKMDCRRLEIGSASLMAENSALFILNEKLPFPSHFGPPGEFCWYPSTKNFFSSPRGGTLPSPRPDKVGKKFHRGGRALGHAPFFFQACLRTTIWMSTVLLAVISHTYPDSGSMYKSVRNKSPCLPC